MVLRPGDLVYASYPRKRDGLLHDHTWGDNERQQQQIWRRRNDPSGNHYIDITGKVKTLSKVGQRIDLTLQDGTPVTAHEHGESAPGMLIGKIDGGEDGA